MTEPFIIRRENWIDFCRGIAIIAVIIDHTSSYYPSLLVLHTAFSVPMFVFLGGITSCMSLERRTQPTAKYIVKRLRPIIGPYLVANAAYQFVNDKLVFSLHNYLTTLFLFSGSPPFYFLVFYPQLIILSPYLYEWFIRNKSYMICAVALMASYAVSLISQHHTFILDVHGGGKYLFGGTFLFLFVAGMVTFQLFLKRYANLNYWIIGAFAVLLLSLFDLLGLIHNVWHNPPNMYSILYSLIAIVICIAAAHILESRKSFLVYMLRRIVNLLGTHSLYIYLYHLLIIRVVTKVMSITGIITWSNGPFTGIILLLSALSVPILFETIITLTSAVMQQRLSNQSAML